MCHLFELHQKGTNYAHVTEHHDGVAVLDCNVDPKHADCFQVKTKKGEWSLKDLTRQPSVKCGKAASVLRKMYSNCIALPARVWSLNFCQQCDFQRGPSKE